ncbi:MAG: S41 family peptidase [Patescibacteria group bacterium]
MAFETPSRRRFGDIARAAVILAVVVVLSFGAGVVTGAGTGSRIFADSLPLLGMGLDSTPDTTADLANFWKAWNTLEGRFVQTSASSTMPTAQERIWGAIQGLAGSYGDPYTMYLAPEDAKIFKDDIMGNFSGIGAEIGLDEDRVLTVIAPLKNSPAEKAGLEAGDRILAIGDVDTTGMTVEEGVKYIRGDKGTPVTFRVLRDGEVLEITIIRDIIQVPTLDQEYDAETGIYTITLHSFTATANRLFADALTDFRKTGSTKLLIDLRGNPGGYLSAAVQISSRFLPKGEVVVTEDYDGKRDNLVHRSSGSGGVNAGTKIVILIDKGSASASEIVAGALRDHEVATLIGTKSFGKGSVQELIDVDGGALKITIARWITPSGDSISAGGLTPDIEVERTPEEKKAGKDPQKERAVQFLVTGK